MGIPYVQRFDGEWVDVTAERCLACCDCGLVHNEEYRIIEAENGNEHILRRVVRNNRATANRRMSMKARSGGVFAKKRKK